ncbi:hypothetical protein KXV68_004540 [Aspergillus fumigatus]|nr:hypothetical protein KXX67_004339 [Aspergillus fumigatus]KAH1564557.1 hypothetical protein KXX28_003870 [Aspergillus fumigatus]KAH1625363.1 hypothetical protein KXX39_006240 [Aspergillus fumigatus]KAH1635439.1 hypothetical protein KXX59_004047 [Aspergillus fumigatus]KAH1685372.1 hypothetical protein KXX23_005977 [Aspergillus fumigatus]
MRPRRRTDFAIAIICALPLEAEAVEALFDEGYDQRGEFYGKQRGDANTYVNGRIGQHDVVLCYMPGMGKGRAASVASSLLVSYPEIELALVVGICGGAPPPPKYQEIFLGDVIISDSVIEYDFGRQYPGGFQRKTGLKDTLGRLSREIRTLLNSLRVENARRHLQNQTQQHLHVLQQRGPKWSHPRASDVLFESRYRHKHYRHASPAGCSCFGSDSFDQFCEEALGTDCDDLGCDQGQQVQCQEISEAAGTSIYIGPVTSANTVMKSGQHRDEIVRNEKVIGFKMEGAGVWDNIPCIIIKGVCDYADSHKSKVWQAYAAATGASAAKALLESWIPTNHKDPSSNRHLMIPFARNPHFVGRQKEIQEIEDSIYAPDGLKKLAITGLGGVGKTQIALELAYRMRDREPECSIFWIPCTSYEAVEQAYISIAQMVGLHTVEPGEMKERLQTYFSQTDEKWILIFDNADEMAMWVKGSPAAPSLKNIIPRSENGHVLFTSRNRQLALKLAASNVVSVPDVDQNIAKEIFRKLLIRKDLLQDDYVTSALLEQLAFLPLAISQAAACINQNDISLARYMSLLGEQEASTMELLGGEFEDDGRYAGIQNTVATTWLISFLQIQQVDEVGGDYLSFMACINPRDIPESILPPTTSTKRKVEALGLLKAYSFVNAQVNDNFPNNDNDNRRMWRDYLPHTQYLTDSAEFQAYQADHDDFLARIGSCLQSDGRYGKAEIIFRNALEIRERACGLDHPDTLASISQLGSVLARQGKYEEAEAMHRQALQGYEKVLGSEHPSTLTTMHNLAFNLKQLGKVSDALSLLKKCAHLRNKVLGSDHSHAISSYNTLHDWETAASQLQESQKQHALSDTRVP